MKTPPSNSGFSLIEILVATTLLIVIVIMVGMVFQQSTLAWNSGMRRVEGTILARTAIGMIERDLRKAIDGRGYKDWRGGTPAIFVTDSSLIFLTFSDVMEQTPSGLIPVRDRVVRIEYDAGASWLVRRETPMVWDPTGSMWKDDDSIPSVESRIELTNAVATVQLTFGDNGTVGGSTPTDANAVTINVEVTTQENLATVRVRSLGPDGREYQKGVTDDDDIVIW